MVLPPPAYAIPPPEALALLGGSLVYPGSIIIGGLLLLSRYLWIKTKLYLFWRRFLPKIFGVILVIALYFVIPPPNQWWVENHPVDVKTIELWEQSSVKPVFVDLRNKSSYEQVHVANALNFPFGKGLTSYLANNSDKRIIFYCEEGIKSATLRWLDVDKSLLKKALAENRLYYFADGVHSLIKMGDKTPVPVVIQLSSFYADYLIKHENFAELPISERSSAFQWVQDYERIGAKGKIPIINTKLSQDLVLQGLKGLNTNHFYFTSITKNPPYPLAHLLVLVLIIFILNFLVRRKEFLRVLFNKTAKFHLWKLLGLSVLTSIALVQFGLFQIPIPFDSYLYKISTDLPLPLFYLFLAYGIFSLVFLLYAIYPEKARMLFLQNQIKDKIAPKKYLYFTQKLSWKKGLILVAILYGFYLLELPLASVLLLSVFLLIPLLVDLLIYCLLLPFKNTPAQINKLLHQAGYQFSLKKTPFIRFNTDEKSSLGRISATLESDKIGLGLFSGRIFQENGKGILEKHGLDITNLHEFLKKIRALLEFFQQDFEISFDTQGNISSLELFHNTDNPKVINRNILLKHTGRLVGDLSEQRFSSLIFEEVFENPSPLMLDLLKKRWDKQGGSYKALRKLGFFTKYNDLFKDQFLVFSHRIYVDKALENSLFSSHKILLWLRKKLLAIHYHLATESILPDYYTLLVPQAELRLINLSEALEKPLSEAQLKRKIQRALRKLYKESALGQFYASLLHQQVFNRLKEEAEDSNQSLADLINYSPSQLPPLPSYYELSDASKLLPKTGHPTHTQTIFFKVELVRSHLRNLQLREWHLINLLVEKFRQQLGLPLSLVYLTLEDLYRFPRHKVAQLDLLAYRKKQWQEQNSLALPKAFSIENLEEFKVKDWTEEAMEEQRLRVSGNQPILIGKVVHFQEDLILKNLPKTSILVADNLRPEQVLLGQHLCAILLKKGGYLSHSAIIAREKNIPLLVQCPITNWQDQDRILIEFPNKITQLTKSKLNWQFLEEVPNKVLMGNKAKRLAILSNKGYQVPPSIFLRHKSIEEAIKNDFENYAVELEQILKLLTLSHSSIILRSSTNVEDRSHHSYAGIFYSQAGICTVEQLSNAIKAAWQNLKDRQILIENYGNDESFELNLILQPYLQGQAGGVLFTASEKPGQMQLEVSREGVEAVTEGNAVLNSLYLDENAQIKEAIGDKSILSPHHYRSLYQLGTSLARLFRRPQDIEWILCQETIFIIQSRDISSP